jgi:hypothetical protein
MAEEVVVAAEGDPETSNNLPTEIDPVERLTQDPYVGFESDPDADVETDMPEVVE